LWVSTRAAIIKLGIARLDATCEKNGIRRLHAGGFGPGAQLAEAVRGSPSYMVLFVEKEVTSGY